jgi:hypothetical protein
MRYTRKNVSELLEAVKGGQDLSGFSTSTFAGYSWNLVGSFGGGVVWQQQWSGTWTCEDGGRVTAEDASTFHC